MFMEFEQLYLNIFCMLFKKIFCFQFFSFFAITQQLSASVLEIRNSKGEKLFMVNLIKQKDFVKLKGR